MFETGSVLSPLLFLSYISDLPNSSKIFSCILFADEANIYCQSDDLTLLTRKLNKELKKVKLCLHSNKFALTIGKTNLVLFHSSQKKMSRKFKLKTGNQEIQRTKYVKFLGVFVVRISPGSITQLSYVRIFLELLAFSLKCKTIAHFQPLSAFTTRCFRHSSSMASWHGALPLFHTLIHYSNYRRQFCAASIFNHSLLPQRQSVTLSTFSSLRILCT